MLKSQKETISTRGKVFIDTNIFIYALTQPKDPKENFKRDSSIELLKKVINSNQIIISTQIVNELHFNLLRKFNIEDKKVFETIESNVVKISNVVPLCQLTYKKAFEVRENYKLSFWDSLVVASALINNCSTLYSEDMQNNLLIQNTLIIKNPIN